MKAVTGTVTSSKPISLSKASTALSRFAAGDNGARREISAYLKRVSNAFPDPVQVHRELRFIRKGAGVEIQREVEDEDESSRSRKKEEQKDPKSRVSLQANAKVKVEVVDEEVEDEAEERRKKKNKEKRREKEVVDNGEGKKRKHLSVEEAKGSMEDGSERREK
ncbi:uncharacterized protein A4U43_C03F18550 [Asparagus officinalis]|uniref:Uncharacterized protein n=1 Tax=Asparagus officinalis TaxID=4686 RepID=A0A5P1FB71_ASPOF|nr:protein MNN4-like [Asparagus officinalis]ONK75595.1 uncharacterized protein A4U43_C03F18550 [Asparagus officinalis]